ncbi:Zn-dependent alcohol dehydrogenase [soil metagenome]
MKAVIVKEFGKGFSTEEVQIAAPIGQEVLVDVKASGLCHTDLTASNFNIGYATPSLLGHEVAGIVAAIGPDVTEFTVGDHVVGCLVQYCGKCEKCLSGKIYQCLHPEATLRTATDAPRVTLDGAPIEQGFGLGGFAEQSLIHESQLVKVADAMPFPQAALLGCGVVTGAGAVLNSANVQAGDSVVILGAGGVGLNAISGAVVAGATTIIAVDVADDKLEKARRFGATHVVNSKTTDPVVAVREITGGGADAVFDFVGLPAVSAQGLEMAGIGGGLYLIGALNPEHGFTVNNIATIGGQKHVHGVIMGSTTPKRDIPLYADLYLQGKFNLDDLVSKEISLGEVNEGYEALHDSAVTRVVITSF